MRLLILMASLILQTDCNQIFLKVRLGNANGEFGQNQHLTESLGQTQAHEDFTQPSRQHAQFPYSHGHAASL